MVTGFARIFLISSLLLTGAVAAAGNEIPDSWRDVGAVETWTDLDSHFYRIVGLTDSPGPQTFDFDQKSIYAETRVNQSRWAPVDLAAFQALSLEARSARQSEARRLLRRVERFRLRIADLVLRVKGQYDVGWGKRGSDERAVGDMLGKLHTAVGLDPSNAYAWHLLAYLAANCGDHLRALDALDGCDAALAAWPDSVVGDVRRRARLDRAWLMRDLGYFAQATEILDDLGSDDRPSVETHLLRGLIAAQTGDLNAAFRFAAALGNTPVPVFQLDWEARFLAAGILDPQRWPTKPSAHLKGWILALAWLQEGDIRQARQAFPEYSLDRHYALGHRFLNEAALIYEATGRFDLASSFWAVAQQYVPYHPYLVFKPYGLNIAQLTGRQGQIPFMLAFDSHLQTGSRLAYGMALVSQAAAEDDRDRRAELAARAVTELEISLRSGVNTASSALALGYAQALLGNPFAMLRAAETATKALDRPGQDQSIRAAVDRLRQNALGTQQHPALAADEDRLAIAGETLPAREDRLRAAFAANPQSDAARQALARHLLRHGDPVEAAGLIEAPLQQDAGLTVEDWILVLELDRLRNDSRRAAQMLEALQAGQAERWPEPRLWLLVGIICEEHGLPEARGALAYAAALAPANRALQEHLERTVP